MFQSITKVLQFIIENATHIVLLVMLVISLGFLYSFWKDNKHKDAQLSGIEDQYRQISSKLAKLTVDYEDTKSLKSQEEAEWKNEKAALEGQIKALVAANFEIPSYIEHSPQVDLKVGARLTEEVHLFDLSHSIPVEGPPIGVVVMDTDTGLVAEGPYKASIKVDADIHQEANGEYHMLMKGTYTLLDEDTLGNSHPELHLKNWLGIPFPLDITAGQLTVNPTSPKTEPILKNKLQVAPHLNMGGFVGVATGLPQYGMHSDISLFGYGKTKNDLDYKFIGLGLNANRSYVDVNVTPISYRLGNVIPLLSNTYVGVGFGFGSEGTSAFGTINTTL